MSGQGTEETSKMKRKPKSLDISAKAIIDNMVFSKKEVWAYYRVPPKMFEFAPESMQIADAAKLSIGYTNLVEGRTDPLELHFITTSTPIDVASWRSQVHAVVEGWQTPEALGAYFDEMTDYVVSQGYTKRVAYVGVQLGKRGAINFESMNPLEAGVQGAVETLKNWAEGFTKTFGAEVSEREERDFRSREERMRSNMKSSGLISEPISAEELLLLIKRQFYPSMPTPYLDVDHDRRMGPGDIEIETAAVFKNLFRSVKINQLIDNNEWEGYRGVISLTKFAREAYFPHSAYPFMYIPSLRAQLPFTTYSRVKLIPREKIRKEIEKRRKEQADQIKNMQAGGQSEADATVADNSKAAQDIQDLRTMDSITQEDRAPWVEGSYRVVIEGPTEKSIRTMFAELKQKYSEMGIGTILSAGDQESLFLEQMPGDRMRINSFKQVTNVHHLSSSGFDIASNAGDPIEIN